MSATICWWVEGFLEESISVDKHGRLLNMVATCFDEADNRVINVSLQFGLVVNGVSVQPSHDVTDF